MGVHLPQRVRQPDISYGLGVSPSLPPLPKGSPSAHRCLGHDKVPMSFVSVNTFHRTASINSYKLNIIF